MPVDQRQHAQRLGRIAQPQAGEVTGGAPFKRERRVEDALAAAAIL